MTRMWCRSSSPRRQLQRTVREEAAHSLYVHGTMGMLSEASCCLPAVHDISCLACTGRGRFKSQASGPARIADREKKAPLKT